MEHKIEIVLTEDEIKKLKVLLMARKACGEWSPEHNSQDAVCLKVLLALAKQETISTFSPKCYNITR